jgi:hypothetical protein
MNESFDRPGAFPRIRELHHIRVANDQGSGEAEGVWKPRGNIRPTVSQNAGSRACQQVWSHAHAVAIARLHDEAPGAAAPAAARKVHGGE